MQKILITGAAGFLGVNLSKKLLCNENNIIYGIDNFSSSDISNLYPLLKSDRFNFIEGDIKTTNLPYADKIFHLVGCGNFEKYFLDKYDFIYSQIELLDKILTFATQNSSKVVIVSDFENRNSLKREFDLYFDYIKLSNSMIMEYHKTYKTDTKIARISKIYGSNISKENLQLIENIIYKVLNNETIELGYNLLDYFTYMDDVVEALNIIMENEIDENIIDISSVCAFELKEFVQYILQVSNSNAKVILKNSQTIKPNYIPNTDILKNKFGFECSNDFRKNLDKIIKYFKIMYFS